MDTVAYPAPVLRRTLGWLGATNRWFGGARLVLDHLSRWSARWEAGRTVRILDVGSGGADIPRAMAAWGRRKGFRLEITALELMPEIAAIARENTRDYPEIAVRQENLFRLAGNRESFDYVTASLFIHHMPPGQDVEALRAFDRLARRGVIVSDLERSRTGYGAVALASLAGNFVVRHDAPLSVRRAFLPHELGALAASAGLFYLRVRLHPWFRLSLAGEKA